MASEVHQEIVAYLTNGWSASAIVEQVKRSVSEAYVQQMTNSLLVANQAVSKWSMIKLLLFVATVAPAIFLTILIFGERHKPYTMFASQERLDVFATQGWFSYLAIGAVLTILAGVSVLTNRWWHRRWLRKSGGKILEAWVEKNGLLVGRWSTVLAVGLATAGTGKLFEQRPAWVDRDGKLYGMLQVHQPPQIAQPVIQTAEGDFKNPIKQHKIKRKKHAKKRSAYEDMPTMQ